MDDLHSGDKSCCSNCFWRKRLEHVMNNMPAFIMSGLSASVLVQVLVAILLSMMRNKEIDCFFCRICIKQIYVTSTVAIAIIACDCNHPISAMRKRLTMFLRLQKKSGASSSVERRTYSVAKETNYTTREKNIKKNVLGIPGLVSVDLIW